MPPAAITAFGVMEIARATVLANYMTRNTRPSLAPFDVFGFALGWLTCAVFHSSSMHMPMVAIAATIKSNEITYPPDQVCKRQPLPPCAG